MRKFVLNKLVRDGVLDSMLEAGQQPLSRQLEGQELLEALGAKLVEEATEFDPANPDLSELNDFKDVIDAIVIASGGNLDEQEHLREEKRTKMGGFAGHHFVSEITLEDSDQWVEYYASNPERFPEIKEEI